MERCKLLIIGAGAAGLSCAVSAWEAGCRSIIVADRMERPGGILLQCLHKGFGYQKFGKELTGPEYVSDLTRRFEKTKAELRLKTTVLSVNKDKTALLSGPGGVYEISFERLILATGCRERAIGSLPVTGTRPAGIYTAGEAQEMVNLRNMDPGDDIVILGCGDMGMIMAGTFAEMGKNVICVIEKEKAGRGLARNYRRCIEENGIPVRFNTVIEEISGEDRISGVTVRNTENGKREFIPCSTLTVAAGLIPERELVRDIGDEKWLDLAGNCLKIYELVDLAEAGAGKTGFAAGKELSASC